MIEYNEIEYCKVKVFYTADTDVVLEKREEAITDLKKKNVKVPGFKQPRTSKTKKNNTKKIKKTKKPTKRSYSSKNTASFERALYKHYKDHLEKQIVNELVAEGYDETLYETKMKPIGYPQISNARLDGNNFSCEMVFLKKPEFELQQYKGFEIPSPESQATSSEIAEQILQNVREQHGDVVPFDEDDFVQKGDSLTMDVITTVDDKQVDQLTQVGLFYTTDSPSNNEHFDNNLYGMKAGESQTFDLNFEDNESFNPQLRGKTATFSVTVNMGTKKVPAALDDELAKKVGLKDYEDLRSSAEGSAVAQIDKQAKMLISNQIVNRILESHDFEVPSWLVLMESQQFVAQRGEKWDDLPDDDILQLNEISKKKVRLSMILDSIRDQEPDAAFSNDEMIHHLRNNLTLQNQDPEKTISRMREDGSLFGVLSSLRDEITVQWIVSQSSILDEGAANAKTEENTVNS